MKNRLVFSVIVFLFVYVTDYAMAEEPISLAGVGFAAARMAGTCGTSCCAYCTCCANTGKDSCCNKCEKQCPRTVTSRPSTAEVRPCPSGNQCCCTDVAGTDCILRPTAGCGGIHTVPMTAP